MVVTGNSGARQMLLRTDERLASFGWPEVKPVDELSLGSEDCFVAGVGFEDRALAGLHLACETSEEFGVIGLHYLPKVEENREAEFAEICQANRLAAENIIYDREDPAGIGLTVGEHTSQFERVYLDISGMSRLLIVQLLAELLRRRASVCLIYTEAEVYPPLEHEFVGSHHNGTESPSYLSSGIFEIVSSPELSSVSMLGSAIRLISFPSFDPSQLSNLVQEVQPTHNDVINGIPPYEDLAWRASAIRKLNGSTVNGLKRATFHDVSTFDYRETLDLLLRIYDQYAVFDRLVVAPTGSKMQAVAVGIMRGVLEDVQIVYPTPLQFLEPSRYTEGVKRICNVLLDGRFWETSNSILPSDI